MQSYRQYRALESAVRKQLEDCPDWKQRVIGQGLGRSQQHQVPTEVLLMPGIKVVYHTDSHGGPQPVFLVDWESEHDPLNPRKFSLRTRIMATLNVSALAFAVSASSSIESAVLAQSSAEYHVSEVVASLFTAIFLLGFAAGSLVSGPLSEILGRNAVYTISTSLFMLFIMGSGLSPNISAKLVCRFLAGVCGCPPLTCAGGTVADIWDPLEKTLSFPGYAILSFGGAILSPVVASYMGQKTLSWRWVNWIVLIMAGLVLGLIVLLQPETFGPLLLRWKAKLLRQITGDPRFRSKMDLDQTSIVSRITTACTRQFTLAVREPIILLLALYMTILYIVLFTFFDGYSYIFSDVHHLSQGLTNIVWVAMYVGIMLAAFLVPLMYWRHQQGMSSKARDPDRERALNETKSIIQPEDRLWNQSQSGPQSLAPLYSASVAFASSSLVTLL
ncbi:hypothetical protein N8T08_000901 [Aspergillus melleus]|uniref:Uncharacterized protein n=1 Tax=Aspergillus melleus TaxID=138277 RepID=A0ACC3BAP3_9EURO|nr:hypothetical protein N8T08_000901 [Aspergillus melleus]